MVAEVLPPEEFPLELEYGELVLEPVDDADCTVLIAEASPELHTLGFQQHLRARAVIVQPGKPILPILVLIERLLDGLLLVWSYRGVSIALPLRDYVLELLADARGFVVEDQYTQVCKGLALLRVLEFLAAEGSIIVQVLEHA